MSYVLTGTRPLRFGGKEYCPGEMIPDGVILPTRVRKLKSEGCIKEIDGLAKALNEPASKSPEKAPQKTQAKQTPTTRKKNEASGSNEVTDKD